MKKEYSSIVTTPRLILMILLFILTIGWILLSFIYLKKRIEIIPICLFIPNILIFLSTLLFNLSLTLIYGGLLLIIDFIFYLSFIKITSQYNTLSFLVLLSVGAFETVIFSYYNRLQIEKRSSRYAIEEQEELYNILKDEHLKNLTKNEYLKSELARMKKLSHTATLLGTAFDSLDEIFTTIVRETRNILQQNKVLFSIFDESHNCFIAKNIYGYNKNYIGQRTDNIDEWLTALKIPVIINNIEKESRIKLKRYSNFSNARAIIASPVMLKDKVYGVLRVESDEAEKFTNEDLRVLSYITDMASIVIENNYYFKEVEKLAITDGITELYVHRYFIEKLDIEIKRFFRHRIPLSLIMLDIDNFKILNDTYGHQFGDKVLVAVAKAIKSEIREVDFPARYGGDEFVVILPHTDIKGARIVGERLFNKICAIDLNLIAENIVVKHSLSVSMGIGSFKKKYKERKTFINEIDKKLYEAKAKGKKRIEILR